MLPARGIFAQLCSLTQLLIISINQWIGYLSKAYFRAKALLQTCWGHFRKTNVTFLYQGNHKSGGERKSHFHTQIRSDFAYQHLQTLWHFHCSLYAKVPCPKEEWGKVYVNFSGPCFQSWLPGGRTASGFLSMVSFPSLLLGPRAVSIWWKEMLGTESPVCTLGILEKCCNFWKLFCEVPSEGSYFIYFYLVPQPSLVLRQHLFFLNLIFK